MHIFSEKSSSEIGLNNLHVGLYEFLRHYYAPVYDLSHMPVFQKTQSLS